VIERLGYWLGQQARFGWEPAIVAGALLLLAVAGPVLLRRWRERRGDWRHPKLSDAWRRAQDRGEER